jgi:integrase
MGMCVSEKLAQWAIVHSFGKKAGTKKFHKEVIAAIERNWIDCNQSIESITAEQLFDFARKVEHFCPSRWNLIVTILRSITPHADALRYRKLRFRDFTPPTEEQWATLLAECDRLPRSKAGLIIRLLTLTGLRIEEARVLRWEHVREDRIYVPAAVTKNGKPRVIPLLPGADAVLKTLRDAPGRNGRVLPTVHCRKGLQKACRAAGLKYLSYHCFRHLFATRCIESGVDIPTVARWLGHQDGGALLSRMYFHLLDGHSKLMALKVKIAV